MTSHTPCKVLDNCVALIPGSESAARGRAHRVECARSPVAPLRASRSLSSLAAAGAAMAPHVHHQQGGDAPLPPQKGAQAPGAPPPLAIHGYRHTAARASSGACKLSPVCCLRAWSDEGRGLLLRRCNLVCVWAQTNTCASLCGCVTLRELRGDPARRHVAKYATTCLVSSLGEVCGLSACPVVRARDVRSRQSLSPQALRPLSERESRQRPRECGTQRRPDAAREGSGERSNLVGCVMPLDDAQGSAAAGGEQGQAKPELSVSFFEFGCVRVQRGRQRWGRARPHFGQKPSREGAQSLGCCWRCGRSWRCGRAL